MDPLYSPVVVRDILKRYGLAADKGFGQNFLIDANVLGAITDAASIQPTDTVLEVGPGLGVLTRELGKRAGQVFSVELDARLLRVLEETVGSFENVNVVHGDGLEYDLSQLPPESLLVANLPYNVATPIIVRALESGRFRRLVFLVQREVAQRLAASPGDEQFGALSHIIAHYGTAKTVKLVKPSAFFPPPEVTSAVVRLEVTPGVVPDPATFALIHTSFKHRRKTLKKNLLMAGYPPERVRVALQGVGLDERVRAEVLTLDEFRHLLTFLE